ncbi:hypothetical protein SAMD00019534_039000, partial [Acytostelium subglobosum LB1]|uniref:hypothetical protein n=1 Tax=Acytostelium subglobosum LB1 TaxID=1410327 RepID=UPI0006448005
YKMFQGYQKFKDNEEDQYQYAGTEENERLVPSIDGTNSPLSNSVGSPNNIEIINDESGEASSNNAFDEYSYPYSPAQTELVFRRHAKQTEDLRNILTQKRMDQTEIATLKSKRHRGFYIKQNELIDQFLSPLDETPQDDDEDDFKVKMAINGSLLVNVVLFAMQLTATLITGSLSLASTSIDSFMDLLSGFILFMTARARKKQNYFKYPTGKSRMEPVGIIIFAALMSTVSFNLIIDGSTKLIKQDSEELTLGVMPITFVVVAIGCKILMYLYCRVLTHSSSAMTLALDHRNDITVNSFGIVMAILGTYVRWWLDPIGALLVAAIILRSWTSQAYEQIELLVGKSASPEFLQRLTYIAVSHSPEVLKVDTCRAFHVGNNLFVEVDIVLPPNMPLIKTHDIGESLQIKLETLPEVERAFVHVDYEFRHKPEHKRIN